MTLKDLEYFVAIAKEKSITRAAANLFVAQPALSQCIQKLEKELGIALFLRSSSGVLLTSEGRCFLEFAQGVLQERADLNRKIQDVENAENGEIRLGFTGTQATYVLPYILPDFQNKHPSVRITLVEATSDEIEQKLTHKEVDIGILHLPVLRDELDYFEINADNMVVIPREMSNYQDYVYYKDGSENPYINLEFLREEPLVLTQPWQRSRMVTDQILTNAGIQPKIQQISRNLSTLDALAQVNFGTVIMPEKQLSRGLQGRKRFRIEENIAVSYAFVVATLKNAYLPIAVRNMRQKFMDKRYTF